jgi:mono/diheme cytochrome c family protein
MSINPTHMKKFICGVLVGICLPFVVAYVFVAFGGMPVATKGQPLPLERFIAGKALHAAMDRDVGKPSPLPLDEVNLLAGARVYQAQCGVCHGRLDRPASAIATGLFPPVPQLLRPGKGVTDDLVGETYWKARNGIRLTGMPGFVGSLSDAELWQVSLFLRNADKLPVSVQQILRAGD